MTYIVLVIFDFFTLLGEMEVYSLLSPLTSFTTFFCSLVNRGVFLGDHLLVHRSVEGPLSLFRPPRGPDLSTILVERWATPVAREVFLLGGDSIGWWLVCCFSLL